MSIGWVMFWKAIVLGIWAGIVERWQSKKEAHRANGLELRYNPKTGSYEAYCPYTRAEQLGRRALWIVGVPFAIYTVVVLYFFLEPVISR